MNAIDNRKNKLVQRHYVLERIYEKLKDASNPKRVVLGQRVLQEYAESYGKIWVISQPVSNGRPLCVEWFGVPVPIEADLEAGLDDIKVECEELPGSTAPETYARCMAVEAKDVYDKVSESTRVFLQNPVGLDKDSVEYPYVQKMSFVVPAEVEKYKERLELFAASLEYIHKQQFSIKAAGTHPLVVPMLAMADFHGGNGFPTDAYTLQKRLNVAKERMVRGCYFVWYCFASSEHVSSICDYINMSLNFAGLHPGFSYRFY